jgi:hypothetical protein
MNEIANQDMIDEQKRIQYMIYQEKFDRARRS